MVNSLLWVEKPFTISFKEDYPAPYLIDFPSLGLDGTGFLSVAENADNIPFDIQRVFWTYDVPEKAIRGEHAHHRLEQILIAVKGTILVITEQGDGLTHKFVLDSPTVGLYIPPHVWHYMEYSGSAIQVVLASMPYSEEEYIRSYEKFKEIYK
ncbi:MAG: FdtA/QdtA family cupin domain-containing protein [Spirosomataceae bacterium]